MINMGIGLGIVALVFSPFAVMTFCEDRGSRFGSTLLWVYGMICTFAVVGFVGAANGY